MGYAIKRLALGCFLILAASAVLLVSDWRHRQPSRVKIPRIAVFQIVSRQVLDDGVRGCVEVLSERGFVANQTVQIQRFNAEGDLPTANSIAKGIVGGDYDLAVTFSTPALQVLAGANRKGQVPHVFGAVTDPFQSGVGLDRAKPDSRPAHLAGIGTFQPVKEIFRLAKACYPGLSKVGVVWCMSETCSEACTRLAREECRALGIELVEAPVENATEVLDAARSLIGRDVQALWIGGDNIVETAAGSLIRPALDARIPVFANAPDHVDAGALLGLGADYVEVGRAVGRIAAGVLEGRSPSTFPVDNVVPPRLAINLQTLARLRDPWHIPDETRKKAAIVVNEQGVRSGAAARPASTPAAPPAQGRSSPWRLYYIDYVNALYVEEAQAGFAEGMASNGWTEGSDYTVKAVNAQGDMATLLNLMDVAAGGEFDAIVMTSTPALQALVQKGIVRTPVVFGAVANPVLAGAGESEEKHWPNITGISTRSDFEGMVQVVKECLPSARGIGTLYVSSEVNSVFYREKLGELARAAGLQFESVAVTTSSEIPDAAQALVDKDIDVVCQITDNLNDAAFPAIVQAGRNRKKPVFSFVSSQVSRTGAAVAVARDYEQVGRDMADLVVRILKGESPAKIPFRPVSRTRTLASPKNAERFGLQLPDSLLKRAEVVNEDGAGR